MLALPPFRQSSGTWQLWVCDQHLWYKSGDLREEDWIEGREAGLECFGTEPGGDRSIGQLTKSSITTRTCRRHTLSADPRLHLFGQSRFANACFPGEEDDMHSLTCGLAPGILEVMPLCFPTK